jgi:Uma2 family endonuclease
MKRMSMDKAIGEIVWYNLFMAPQVAEPRTRHWTLVEYYQLAEEGYFQGQRVQLIEGEIIQMPPQGHAHAIALTKISRWLYETFREEYLIRIQMPLDALADSDPEPDAAVVPGPADQYHDHPNSALLIVEVADSSLRLDRRKARIYAAAKVQEYWIVDLTARHIEIYRNNTAEVKSPEEFSYPPPRIAGEHESISPLAMPGAQIKVSDLLP